MTSVAADVPPACQRIGLDGFRRDGHDEAGDRHLRELNSFFVKDGEVVAKRDQHALDYSVRRLALAGELFADEQEEMLACVLIIGDTLQRFEHLRFAGHHDSHVVHCMTTPSVLSSVCLSRW